MPVQGTLERRMGGRWTDQARKPGIWGGGKKGVKGTWRMRGLLGEWSRRNSRVLNSASDGELFYSRRGDCC